MHAEPTQSLIAYIHVPKVGGTTIREYLREHGGPGAEFETDDNGNVIQPGHVPQYNWVAGHVQLARVMRVCQSFARPIQYFGSIRQPKVRLASYFNHRLAQLENGELPLDPGPVSGIHRDFFRVLRATDFQSVASVCALLLVSKHAFVDQTAKLMGRDWLKPRPSDDFIDAGLSVFTLLAEHDRPDRLIEAFGFGHAGDAARRHLNIGTYRFDPAILDDPQVASVLGEKMETENRVYARASLMFGASPPE